MFEIMGLPLSRYIRAILRSRRMYLKHYYVLCDNLKWVSNCTLKLHISILYIARIYRNCDCTRSKIRKWNKRFPPIIIYYYILYTYIHRMPLLKIIANRNEETSCQRDEVQRYIISLDKIWFRFSEFLPIPNLLIQSYINCYSFTRDILFFHYNKVRVIYFLQNNPRIREKLTVGSMRGINDGSCRFISRCGWLLGG